jgi:pilus assembly protein CpaC
VAGLLSDRVRSSVDKVPVLGDLPILGALFRSTSYRREETELLVVVTAHIVRPTDGKPGMPGEDTKTDPSDLELFLLGSYESKPGGDAPASASPASDESGDDEDEDKPKPAKKKRKPTGAVGFRR